MSPERRLGRAGRGAARVRGPSPVVMCATPDGPLCTRCMRASMNWSETGHLTGSKISGKAFVELQILPSLRRTGEA